jgi:hypothetical protein
VVVSQLPAATGSCGVPAVVVGTEALARAGCAARNRPVAISPLLTDAKTDVTLQTVYFLGQVLINTTANDIACSFHSRPEFPGPSIIRLHRRTEEGFYGLSVGLAFDVRYGGDGRRSQLLDFAT